MTRHRAVLSAAVAAAAGAVLVLLLLSEPAADQSSVLSASEPSAGHHAPAPPPSSVAPPAAVDSPEQSHLGAPGRPGRGNQQCAGTPGSRPLGEADGALPNDATVFDDEYPGIANLDRDLLQALRQAAHSAANNGVKFLVNSGWRSKEYQEQLLCEAVSEYGSKDDAAEWVASPATSFHVSGEAVDLGSAARAWLSKHGARYGLCQIYRNELWHYELRPDAIHQGCPRMYANPQEDPRMPQ